MREAVGGALLIKLVMFFIVIYVCFMAIAVNYSITFRVKNQIINLIEAYEGYDLAEEHIKEEGDGENTINVHVVRALLSRFCLFEGTWRKYHALGDEDKYFDACITYSKIIRCNQRNGENRRNRCKKISYETFKGCYCSCIAEEHFILRLTAF